MRFIQDLVETYPTDTEEFLRERLRIVEKTMKLLEYQAYMIRRRLIQMCDKGIVLWAKPEYIESFQVVPKNTILAAFEKKFFYIESANTSQYRQYIRDLKARIKQIDELYRKLHSERNTIGFKMKGRWA